MCVSILYWHQFAVNFILLSSTLHSVGVFSQLEGDLRLSGYGTSRLAGRLEIYLRGEWGTVCANDDMNTAKVACRQLRLGHFIGQVGTSSLRYGIGDGTIWLENVDCHDDDLHILRCTSNSVGPDSTCDHTQDLTVTCSGISTPYEGEVRLVGGAYASQGVVEMYLHRQWSQVCSTDMEPRLADSICRQLGYTRQISIQPLHNTTGLYWPLPSSNCTSSQSCIRHCLPGLPAGPQPLSTCTGDNKAWEITCRALESEFENVTSGSVELCTVSNTVPEDGEVRLTGFGQYQGRVELFLHGEWATLYMLGSEGATVVCKQLGYPTYIHSNMISDINVDISPLDGPQYDIICTGLETHVNACMISTNIFQNHDDDAYIHCSSILWPYGSLRLVGGAGPFGQLQVSPGPYSFNWLCDAHFSMSEANVACRQLGYTGALRIVHNSVFSDTSATSLLSYSLHCHGNEDYLLECQRRSVLVDACRESLDAVAVQCGPSSLVDGWKVQLRPVTNSSNNDSNHDNIDSNHGNSSEGIRSGIVEVMLEKGGEWGTVCADDFSNLSAHVICRQIGFETFNEVHSVIDDSISESGDGVLRPVHLSTVQCRGFEEFLDYCHHTLATGSCNSVVSVVCSDIIPYPDGTLRLLDSTDLATPPQNGRLEVSFHGLWMSVCGRLFTQQAADVACKQLGFQPAANYCLNACFGPGSSDVIHFGEYSCLGNESGLLECRVHIHNADSCSHDDDVGLWCLPFPDVPNIASSSTSLQSSSIAPSSPPALSQSHITTSIPSSPPTTSLSVGQGPVSPTEKNGFTSDGIFYVVAVFICLLFLALIISITICCVCHKKKGMWDIQPQNGSYSDRNEQAINAAACQGNGGTQIREVTDGGDDEETEFDFDAVADTVEMKACAKAVEAMKFTSDLTSDRISLSSSSAGLPPQYHELDFLSHSIPTEESKEIT